MTHKLTSSQAHASNKRVLFVVAAGISIALQSGCGRFAGASSKTLADLSTREQSRESAPVIIDAGIVFADEANYLCLPFSRLGIEDSDEVLSVRSSCECSRPYIVSYHQ